MLSPFVGKPGFSLTETGYVAMTIGLMAAILPGLGIVLLIHHANRRARRRSLSLPSK